jgi:hypothetical protein
MEKTGSTRFGALNLSQSIRKSLALRFPSPLREKVTMRGFVRVTHPHPWPLPQAGEGSDLILTLSQSARLLIFSLSERHHKWAYSLWFHRSVYMP